MVLWAAVAVAICGASSALGATYTTDKTYTFPGQDWSNSGRGLAVNRADTRLYAAKRSSSAGAVYTLNTADGSLVGTITPPAGSASTSIYDVALSPDDATLYFARSDGSGGSVIDAAPASDGDRAAADVPGSNIDAPPAAIAMGSSGTDTYLAAVTDSYLWVFKQTGSTFTQTSKTDIGYRSAPRDVAAVPTASGLAFYVLTPSSTMVPDVRAYNPDGTERSVSFASVPSGFTSETFDSITYAGTVDGVPSLFIAADTLDTSYNSYLTFFRYGTDGSFAGDGFGYGLSPADQPLGKLAPLGTDTMLVPGAVANGHVYLGGRLPGDTEETVRVAIGSGGVVPGSITGTVLLPNGSPAAGAHVLVQGRTGETLAGADGTFTLSNLNPDTYRVGAWVTGDVAASATVTLASGETKTGLVLQLPGTVPTFTLNHVYLPPIIDGEVFPGEYPSDAMPFYQLGGAAMPASIATTAYSVYDNDYLYVAVVGAEPSLNLNRSAWDNANMLLSDDTVQIYLDPPHRHDVPSTGWNLDQFAVNIPALINGQQATTPKLFERRIDAQGNYVQDIPASAWTARVGYSPTGWTVEARISLDALGILQPPAPGAEWGLLVGRNRPDAHQDVLPNLYSTSPAQQDQLTAPDTWTDIGFGAENPALKGDVNRSGAVDWSDVVLVLRMAGGLTFGTTETGAPDPASNQSYRNAILAAADVWPNTPDQKITLEDAVRLARVAAGKDTLP